MSVSVVQRFASVCNKIGNQLKSNALLFSRNTLWVPVVWMSVEMFKLKVDFYGSQGENCL